MASGKEPQHKIVYSETAQLIILAVQLTQSAVHSPAFSEDDCY